MRKLPKAGDRLLINVLPEFDKEQNLFTGKSVLCKKSEQIERTIALVYRDGTVKDSAGGVWKVMPKDDYWQPAPNQRVVYSQH